MYLSLTRNLQRRAAQTCGEATVPLRRAWSAKSTDHLYTTNLTNIENDIVKDGYVSQGDAGFVYPSQAPNSVPLYRLYSKTATDHYYTTSTQDVADAVSSGYTYQDIEGYVYTTAQCGTVPLYQSYNPTAPDHFYTTDVSERDSAINTGGYLDEGIVMYIFPPQ